ncbi:hypothetical protein ADUPG1_005868, partial [Aduncisulcus paluster]
MPNKVPSDCVTFSKRIIWIGRASMHSIEAYCAHLDQGGFDNEFSLIHSCAGVQESRERMRNLLDCMRENFAPDELCFASAPARTEMGGNHTDHNHGHVLAAAVNLD